MEEMRLREYARMVKGWMREREGTLEAVRREVIGGIGIGIGENEGCLNWEVRGDSRYSYSSSSSTT